MLNPIAYTWCYVLWNAMLAFTKIGLWVSRAVHAMFSKLRKSAQLAEIAMAVMEQTGMVEPEREYPRAEDRGKTKELSMREIFSDLTDEEFGRLMRQWDEEKYGKHPQTETPWPIPPAPPMPPPEYL